MTIVGSTYVPPSNPTNVSWQLQQMQGGTPVDPTAPTTGAGALAGTAQAPDLSPVPGLNAIMASVLSVTPKLTGEQLDVLVLSLTTKRKDMIDASEKDKIQIDTAAKREAIKEKNSKLEEAQKKVDDAIEKQKSASIWDKIKLAFSYIGAFFTMLAGAIMIATGAGAVAGGCLIAAGVLMLVMAVDQTVAMANQDQGKGNLGMFGMAAKADAEHRGMSADDADKYAQTVSMGVSIALMGAAFLLSLPAMLPSLASLGNSLKNAATNIAEFAMSFTSKAETVAGTANAVGDAALTAKQVVGVADDAAEAAQVVEQATQAASKTQIVAERIIDVVSDLSQIVDATATVGSAATHYQASESQADAKTLQGRAKVLEALLNTLDDMIDQALARLKDNGTRFNAVLDALTEGVKDKGDTMFHAQFRA